MIPKGSADEDEKEEESALREFCEETSIDSEKVHFQIEND